MGHYLNLGCGDNRLASPPWQNHDADVDIGKRLPWDDGSVRFVVIEHCVEHVGYYEAISFFRECFRVLEIGGVLRVTVPSITQIMNCGEQDYFDWLVAKGWAPTADARGAMDAILHQHGHRQAWTATLMESTLYYCGFPQPQRCDLGWSSHPELRGVEGHAKVIGEKFNAIESMTFECAKMTGDLSVDYDRRFFDMHVGWRHEYENLADVLVEHLPMFSDAVDLGCGNGYLIDSLEKKHGKSVLGYDGSDATRLYRADIIVADITRSLSLLPRDLAICTEVAEHVAAEHADALVDNVCRAARHTIFFSAAKAGHGGHLHLNEQPRSYWVNKFTASGFEVDHLATERVAAALRSRNKRTWWFAENCFVLRRASSEAIQIITSLDVSNVDASAPPRRKIAVVLGGSERVWRDADLAKRFCAEHNLEPTWFATNDMIQRFPEPVVAVTLHPDKLGGWLKQRENAGWPAPRAVWSHDGGSRKTHPHVTHRLRDWGGSVGLFGYVVACNLGHDRVLLCGVPMTSEPHFVRGHRWTAVTAFTRAWENHKSEMMPHARSLSGGWTEQLLGTPDADWLSTIDKEKAA